MRNSMGMPSGTRWGVMRSVGVVAWITLWCSVAAAYPQTVGKGYTNCGTCHYSATGGGLLNSYGHATAEAMFPDLVKADGIKALRKWAAKSDVSGVAADGSPEFQWDVGIDGRVLFVQTPTQVGGSDTLLPVPMLAEAGAVMAFGSTLAYATVTPLRVGAERTAVTPFSREHWLNLGVADDMSVRVGRLTLPFGMKIPDHTQYTREDLGFGKWDQTYAVELSTFTESWMVSSAVYAGDLSLDPKEIQERGGVVSLAYNLPSRGSIGASVLLGGNTLSKRTAAALFARLRVVQRSYVMAEADAYQRQSKKGLPTQTGFAGYLRAGWYAMESLDVYTEFGGRAIVDAHDLTKLRYSVGANWQMLPWLEMSPSIVLEETVETGLGYGYVGQLHLIY